MIKTIKAREIKVGMYISLPHAWRAHPFLRNSFTITTNKQISKIINFGITDVNIDVEKGIAATDILREVVQPEKDFSEKAGIVPEHFREVIADKKMSPKTKAKMVHWHSINMVSKLFDNPDEKSIGQFKEGIVGVVDLILDDNATNHYLMNLTTHDYNTYVHSVNVGVLAVSLAKTLFPKSGNHDMHALGAGFFLHDLGKVYIDEAIINKPGKLTDEEMNEMRKHPDLGFKLLNETNQINEESRLIVLQHHERANGMGYPQKMLGEEIHIYGRICSVADVFDALISKRPYKIKLEPFEALKIMKEEMMEHFNKDIFEKFVLLFK
jgi:HD-GYP domain-containing protein (c-di-GMP phosphodiesterase class II)